MPDPHFGGIDDVWKHLLLSEILAAEKPQEFWASHAGAARYPVAAMPSQDDGVHYAARAVAQSPALGSRKYFKLLQELMADGTLRFYPGSPWLAMTLLGSDIRRYLFCDTEAENLQNIVATANEMRLPDDKVQCVQDDGLSILRGAAIILQEQWTTSTLAFLDPPRAIGLSADGGITPVELFCELTNRGIKTVLCYRFADAAERTACHDAFAAGMQKYKLSQERHHFCRFELARKEFDAAKSAKTSFGGCGLWCSNVGATAIATCQKIGPALAELYNDAKLPDGSSGALVFTSTS